MFLAISIRGDHLVCKNGKIWWVYNFTDLQTHHFWGNLSCNYPGWRWDGPCPPEGASSRLCLSLLASGWFAWYIACHKNASPLMPCTKGHDKRENMIQFQGIQVYIMICKKKIGLDPPVWVWKFQPQTVCFWCFFLGGSNFRPDWRIQVFTCGLYINLQSRPAIPSLTVKTSFRNHIEGNPPQFLYMTYRFLGVWTQTQTRRYNNKCFPNEFLAHKHR